MCPASLQASGQRNMSRSKGETFRWYPLKKKTKNKTQLLVLFFFCPFHLPWKGDNWSGTEVTSWIHEWIPRFDDDDNANLPALAPNDLWSSSTIVLYSPPADLCAVIQKRNRGLFFFKPMHLGIFFYSDLDSCLTRKPSFKGAPFNNLCVTYFKLLAALTYGRPFCLWHVSPYGFACF